MAEVIADEPTVSGVKPAPVAPDGHASRNKILLGLIILVVTAACSCLIWRATNNSKDSANFSYDQSQLKSYHIPGYNSGAGMIFSVPSQLQAAYPASAAKYGQIFGHNKQLTNGKHITITYEAGAISYAPPQSGSALTDSYKRLNDAMNNPSNSSYQTYVATIQTFIKSYTNSRWSFTYQQPKALTTSNLKANTWEVDFTGLDNSPTSSYTPTKLTGEAVYSVTNGNYYYFLVASVNNNWKDNQAVWQEVINSLKVDQ